MLIVIQTDPWTLCTACKQDAKRAGKRSEERVSYGFMCRCRIHENIALLVVLFLFGLTRQRICTNPTRSSPWLCAAQSFSAALSIFKGARAGVSWKDFPQTKIRFFLGGHTGKSEAESCWPTRLFTPIKDDSEALLMQFALIMDVAAISTRWGFIPKGLWACRLAERTGCFEVCKGFTGVWLHDVIGCCTCFWDVSEDRWVCCCLRWGYSAGCCLRVKSFQSLWGSSVDGQTAGPAEPKAKTGDDGGGKCIFDPAGEPSLTASAHHSYSVRSGGAVLGRMEWLVKKSRLTGFCC